MNHNPAPYSLEILQKYLIYNKLNKLNPQKRQYKPIDTLFCRLIYPLSLSLYQKDFAVMNYLGK